MYVLIQERHFEKGTLENVFLTKCQSTQQLSLDSYLLGFHIELDITVIDHKCCKLSSELFSFSPTKRLEDSRVRVAFICIYSCGFYSFFNATDCTDAVKGCQINVVRKAEEQINRSLLSAWPRNRRNCKTLTKVKKWSKYHMHIIILLFNQKEIYSSEYLLGIPSFILFVG